MRYYKKILNIIPLQKYMFILTETSYLSEKAVYQRHTYDKMVNTNSPGLVCTQINQGVILMFILGLTPQFIVVNFPCSDNILTVLTVFANDFPPFCMGINKNIY